MLDRSKCLQYKFAYPENLNRRLRATEKKMSIEKVFIIQRGPFSSLVITTVSSYQKALHSVINLADRKANERKSPLQKVGDKVSTTEGRGTRPSRPRSPRILERIRRSADSIGTGFDPPAGVIFFSRRSAGQSARYPLERRHRVSRSSSTHIRPGVARRCVHRPPSARLEGRGCSSLGAGYGGGG